MNYWRNIILVITKLSVDGKTNYEKNVALKKLISKKLEQEDLNVRAASKWIIQKWGGITRLTKNIEAYIDLETNIRTLLMGWRVIQNCLQCSTIRNLQFMMPEWR